MIPCVGTNPENFIHVVRTMTAGDIFPTKITVCNSPISFKQLGPGGENYPLQPQSTPTDKYTPQTTNLLMTPTEVKSLEDDGINQLDYPVNQQQEEEEEEEEQEREMEQRHEMMRQM